MRAKPHSHDPTDTSLSPVAPLLVATGVLSLLFVLMVAVSYPTVVAAFVLGGLSAVVVRVAVEHLGTDGLRVPGTDIRLRLPSS